MVPGPLLSRLVLGLALLLVAGLIPSQAGAAPLGPQGLPALGPMEVERVFANISYLRMVHRTHASDGTDRLWVVLQPGEIRVFLADPTATSSEVFLDIRAWVNDAGNEEGLLGLAFDPDYAANGYFYVFYTAASPRRSVISRFTVNASDPDRADPSSELVLLEVEQPFPNHNGGTLIFGPDGYLYLGLGDGGLAGDPFGHGQNPATLLGSILRIDVRGATAEAPYRVPLDNPFIGEGGTARAEVWAYGLRNPWKLSFDLATGDLWAADVGQDRYGEVDIIRPGRNYGWSRMEDTHCYPVGSSGCEPAGLEPPVFEYSHDEGCSITGGYVYRGSRLPSLVGAYIYADFCSGRLWGLRYDGTTVTDHALLADTGLNISSFGADAQGEVYILAFDGFILRFASPAPAPTPTLRPTAFTSPEPSPPPMTSGPSPTPTAVQAAAPTPAPGAMRGGPAPGQLLRGVGLLAVFLLLGLGWLLRRWRRR